MKSFLNFFSEARQTKASTRAKQLGLTGDGQGNWVDKAGNIVARTEGGELRFTDRKGGAQRQEPGKAVQYKGPEQELGKKVSSPEEEPRQRTSGEEEGESGDKTGQTLTLVFGRFNPPTVGHKKLLDGAASVAGDGDIRIYPSRSNDPKKNPLEPGQKTELMKKMFPSHADNIINDDSVKTIFNALELANNDGYSNIKIVVGSDRVAEFDNLAQKYNGDLYDFEEIETISAGERDEDAEDVSGMSASKMRKAAAENDFATFRTGIPDNLDDKTAKQIMNTVRKAMNVEEGWSLWEIAPKFDWKNLRENYVTGKIFKINEVVENLNTGLVGKIVRRGTNYLICVTENDVMFKSWIRDLREYSEVKMDRKMRTSDKPNTLSGTTGYFKNAVDMTPGFNKGDKTNLQPGGKPYKGPKSNFREFLNRYKNKSI
jgi:phosphopantetheine adenylyltransferase